MTGDGIIIVHHDKRGKERGCISPVSTIMEEKENGLNQSNTNPEAEKKEEGKLAGILKGTGKGVWKTIKVVFLVWLLLTGVFALFTIGAKVANAGILILC